MRKKDKYIVFIFGYITGSLITTSFFVIGNNWSLLYLHLKIILIIILFFILFIIVAFNVK